MLKTALAALGILALASAAAARPGDARIRSC
jgi:hypothetical protein